MMSEHRHAPLLGEATSCAGLVAHLTNDRSITLAATRPGPPVRIDGYSIGLVHLAVGPGPHAGEVHPDGDELLVVVDGTMDLILDDGDEHRVGNETTIRIDAGENYVVPRGIWHRIEVIAAGRLLHATPGPGGGYRPRT